jgi:hypothetical protein
LKKLTEERTKAREDVDNEKADSLSDQIADKRAELTLLRNERQGHIRNREATAAQTAQQKVTESYNRVIGDYAELQTEGSMHRLALDAYVQRAIDDPQRAALFADPTWPEKLGAEFAQSFGLKKKSAEGKIPAASPAPSAPAQPKTTPPASILRPQPRQVPSAKNLTTGNGANPSPAAQVTAEEVRAALPQMTPAQRMELIRRIPATPRQ